MEFLAPLKNFFFQIFFVRSINKINSNNGTTNTAQLHIPSQRQKQTIEDCTALHYTVSL
jgi:hypothetical protein